jgi:predicted Abi (CAAX) family protease
VLTGQTSITLARFISGRRRVIYINLIGVIYPVCRLLCAVQTGRPRAFRLHFATFCLAAFVFLFYTPVGSYRDLDLAIAFLDNAALILFAPLFLHFCALYPSRQQLFCDAAVARGRVVYAGVLLLALSVVVFLRDEIAKGNSGLSKDSHL